MINIADQMDYNKLTPMKLFKTNNPTIPINQFVDSIKRMVKQDNHFQRFIEEISDPKKKSIDLEFFNELIDFVLLINNNLIFY